MFTLCTYHRGTTTHGTKAGAPEPAQLHYDTTMGASTSTYDGRHYARQVRQPAQATAP